MDFMDKNQRNLSEHYPEEELKHHWVHHNRKHYDPPTKQALQHLQGGTRFGVPAGVLHGAWGVAWDGAWQDAGRCERVVRIGQTLRNTLRQS